MTEPTVEHTETTKESRRCPVFKINLKGQFVNIDDLTSDLLGLPAENLFGRNIKEFLDKESFGKLTRIIQSGKRFDFCYESIVLKIIDNDKKQHLLNAIVSLNFIAGNPANYQIILIELNQDKNVPEKNIDSELLLKKLSGLSSDFARNTDWKKLTELLLKNMKFEQVGIYEFDGENIFLLTDSSTKKGKSEIDYSVIDENLRQAVVDNKSLLIPNEEDNSIEYIIPLKTNAHCWGLMRCLAGDEKTNLKDELEIITNYIGPVFGMHGVDKIKIEKKSATPETNFFEIIKMFDCTIIGVDIDNKINDLYTVFPDKNHIFYGCSDIAEMLERLDSFELIGFSDENSQEIALSDVDPILLPKTGMISNQTKSLFYKIINCKELSGGAIEFTFIIFPEMDNSTGRKTNDELLGMFLETAAVFLEPIDRCASKMAGQFYPRLNKDGRFYLDTIQDNCYVLYRTVNRFRQLYELTNRKENRIEINLNEVIAKTIKEFQINESNLEIRIENSEQIYLTADEVKVSEMLNAIFTGMISLAISDDKLIIGIKLTTGAENCHLQLNFSGNLHSDFDVIDALKPLASIKEIPMSKLAIFENELPVARLLVESLGGEMVLSKTEENKLSAKISLPSKS